MHTQHLRMSEHRHDDDDDVGARKRMAKAGNNVKRSVEKCIEKSIIVCFSSATIARFASFGCNNGWSWQNVYCSTFILVSVVVVVSSSIWKETLFLLHRLVVISCWRCAQEEKSKHLQTESSVCCFFDITVRWIFTCCFCRFQRCGKNGFHVASRYIIFCLWLGARWREKHERPHKDVNH